MTNDVSFDLPDPSYEEYTWQLSDEHTPVAAPPLTSDLFGGRPPGGSPSDDSLPRSLRINGYTYQRHGTGFGGPRGPSVPPTSVEELRAWRHEWQPEVDGVVEKLRGFDPSSVAPGQWAASLEAQAADYWRVFGGVHRTAVMPAHAAAARFRDAYTARFGPESEADAHALLQGMPNASVERAGMLWDLSRILRSNPELMAALDRGEKLPEGDAAAAFEDAFQAMTRRFGDTGEGFFEDGPSWGEDRTIPLAAIRAYATQPDGKGPLDAARQQRERRERLEAELRGLALGEAQAAELVRLMQIAQELMPNLEDHNYYTDQRLSAASRARWLAIGRHLQGRGLIDDASDVFYLYRPELIEALEARSAPDKTLLASRRRELAVWRSVSPPPLLGKPLEAEENEGIDFRGSETRVLRGVAASPGVYRGRARVINSVEDASTLQEGDILVARVTTPVWTPFFGVVSALVINVGGALSHAAIVAREFGLPAVTGTTNGTALIADNATITVDGTSGLVLIED
jgi:rifampicin phosphotransferase